MRILIRHDPKSWPNRDWDYTAIQDDGEWQQGDPIGYGATPRAAFDDLMGQFGLLHSCPSEEQIKNAWEDFPMPASDSLRTPHTAGRGSRPDGKVVTPPIGPTPVNWSQPTWDAWLSVISGEELIERDDAPEWVKRVLKPSKE
jgi:hypothetical protein